MQDQTLYCKGCSAPILFSANQQKFFAKKGFTPPCWCPSCKTKKKNSANLDRKKGYWYDFELNMPRESGDIEGVHESDLIRISDNEIYVKQKTSDGWNFVCSQNACPGPFVKKTYPCLKCGNDYIFTAGAQYFYISKGWLGPHRCKRCRKKDAP